MRRVLLVVFLDGLCFRIGHEDSVRKSDRKGDDGCLACTQNKTLKWRTRSQTSGLSHDRPRPVEPHALVNKSCGSHFIQLEWNKTRTGLC